MRRDGLNIIHIMILIMIVCLLSGKSCEMGMVHATNMVEEKTDENETVADEPEENEMVTDEPEVNETIELSHTELKLDVGKTIKLKLNGATGDIKWSSSNKKIATVTKKGKIKAKRKEK